MNNKRERVQAGMANREADEDRTITMPKDSNVSEALTFEEAIMGLKTQLYKIAIEIERAGGMKSEQLVDEVAAAVHRRIRGEDLRAVALPAKRFVEDYLTPTAQAMGKSGLLLQVAFREALSSS